MGNQTPDLPYAKPTLYLLRKKIKKKIKCDFYLFSNAPCVFSTNTYNKHMGVGVSTKCPCYTITSVSTTGLVCAFYFETGHSGLISRAHVSCVEGGEFEIPAESNTWLIKCILVATKPITQRQCDRTGTGLHSIRILWVSWMVRAAWYHIRAALKSRHKCILTQVGTDPGMTSYVART